jgi:3-hydroxyacyl-CoA dehydrogenase/enoyl-CoA hydratase/3-hydroxybutyryl-CoA epimerase
MQTLRFEIDGSGIALVSILERASGVFDAQLRADLADTVTRLATDATIRGAVIASEKADEFIGSGDLPELLRRGGQETAQQMYASCTALSAILRRLETCGKPVACAINGIAMGPGLELALACHCRVIANRPCVGLGFPDVQFGVMPGAGGTQRLSRLIGIAAALPFLLDGLVMGAERALELGIADLMVPPNELISRAHDWVLAHPGAVARWDVKGFKVPGGTGCLAPHAVESFQVGTAVRSRATNRNYPAPLAILSAVFEGTQVPIDTGLRIESKYHAKVLADPVASNLIRTMLVNKRAADRLSRRPFGFEAITIKRIGVLGAGMMGAGIAYVSAVQGVDVVLLDTTLEAAQKGKAHSVTLLRRELEKGRTTEAKSAELLARITPTTQFDALSNCDLVIEAVFESREVKRAVTEEAGRMLPERAIFASNTSTLPITGLAQAFPRQERFIGLHFFSPVERMPLVEVIRGKQTSDSTLAHALDFVQRLRKTPIVVHDSPGFFTSRVFGTFVDEGMAMLAGGVEPALIENVARLIGMPLGPLAVCDEVTLDLQLKVHEQAVAAGLPAHFQRLTAIDVIRTMVRELKRVGRRVGGGFYEYPAGSKKHLWPGLRAVFPPAPRQPDVEELKRRFLYIQALESAHCFEEGVITHPADADIGSILGIGFPSWTGGTLSFIDTVGIAGFASECKRLAEQYGARFAPSDIFLERARARQPYHTDHS